MVFVNKKNDKIKNPNSYNLKKNYISIKYKLKN